MAFKMEEESSTVRNYSAVIMNDQYPPYPRILSSSELMAAFTALTTSPVSTKTRKKITAGLQSWWFTILGNYIIDQITIIITCTST